MDGSPVCLQTRSSRQLNFFLQCKVAEGEPGRIVIGEFVVGEEHLNRHGKFHGGVGATLVDVASSLAAIGPAADTESSFESTGVSADLSVS